MLKKFLFLQLILYTSLCGDIFKLDHISNVEPFADSETLVFVNLSGTIVQPYCTFTGEQWKNYFIEHVNKNVTDSVVAANIVNKLKYKMTKIPRKLIETNAPKLIASLQEKNITVFGITQKSIVTSYADNFATLLNLNLSQVGFDFSKTLSYATGWTEVLNEPNRFSFIHGVLFCQKQSVGDALIDFLQQNQKQPSKILVVDNSSNSLKKIEETLIQQNIPFLGLRYTRSDERKRNFDPDIGTIQLLSLLGENKLLTDEEAEGIKLANPHSNFEIVLDSLLSNYASFL